MISQVNVYVVDTILRYYVMFMYGGLNIQHKVVAYRLIRL